MTLSDFLIIYLACGAPLGVYFFLQHRNKKNPKIIYLQSFGLVFVWIPYAVQLLHDFITKRFRRLDGEKSVSGKLENLQKQISQVLFDSDSKISLYDFRETIEQYTGLTIARNSADDYPSKTDEEIFRIALRQDIKLGATCLRRRNRLRIELHQTLARIDFLRLVSELSRSVSEREKLRDLTIEFAETLRDAEGKNLLDEIFEQALQSRNENSVQHLEKDLWTAREHKQSSVNKIPLRLRAFTAARKD